VRKRLASVTSSLAVAVVLALGCDGGGAAVDGGVVREHYALSRVGLDPLTEVGALVADDPSLASQLGIVLSLARCDGPAPVLVAMEADAAGGLGTLTLLVGQLAEGQACDGTGTFEVDEAASFGANGEPRAQGPLYVVGRTAEARVPIARVNPSLLGFLPPWWRVTTRREPGTERYGDTEAQSLWRVDQLADVPSRALEGATLLDQLVSLGAQPERDLDRDGLERLLDTDGDRRVDACVDGDGTRWDGADCMRDPRFVDAFELVLRFRLVPAALASP
jgi:hypothetical protein